MIPTQGLQTYPLFVALTRSPMVMGVTQTFFVFALVPTMILFLVSKNIVLAFGFFIIVYGVGFTFCRRDERFFEILLGNFSLTCPNRRLWGCNSYDPY